MKWLQETPTSFGHACLLSHVLEEPEGRWEEQRHAHACAHESDAEDVQQEDDVAPRRVEHAAAAGAAPAARPRHRLQ